MPRRGPAKSLFSSLPLDLKKSLRSQPLRPPTTPITAFDTVQVKAELIADTVQFSPLLSTQPHPIDAFPISAKPIDLTEDEAEASTSASTGWKLRVADTLSPTPRSVSKKRKGNFQAPDNPHLGHPWDCTGLVPRYTDYFELPPGLAKYFAQRHLLFPLYDELPLLLDETGWFSVTPRPIAAHIAERCQCDVIVDAFCGVGGNTMEFARTCERVIAIDNDLTRLRLARHNALHHGVADRIEFVLADYTEFARSYAAGRGKEQIDVVFLSPPWGRSVLLSINAPLRDPGGPDYLNSSVYPLSEVLPVPGPDLFELSSALTPNIAFFLPRNVDIDQVSTLARRLDAQQDGREREWVEIEEEWVGDKIKAVTAYFGGLVASE